MQYRQSTRAKAQILKHLGCPGVIGQGSRATQSFSHSPEVVPLNSKRVHILDYDKYRVYCGHNFSGAPRVPVCWHSESGLAVGFAGAVQRTKVEGGWRGAKISLGRRLAQKLRKAALLPPLNRASQSRRAQIVVVSQVLIHKIGTLFM